MFEERLERVQLLIHSQKFNEAQKEIFDLIKENADEPYLYYLLSNIHYQKEQYQEADQLIDKSIALYPDAGFYYYFKACIKLASEKYSEVEPLLMTAIEIDPEEADFRAKLAQFKLLKKDFEMALHYADEALALDPENILGLNIRSTALMKLGRKEESHETITGALREDPENSFTHSNYGWNLLEKGEHNKALEHFREALKSNPNNEYAQGGMVEALKAKNIIYRGYLKYAFFMQNLSGKNQWIFIIGFYVVQKVLRTMANTNTTLQPYLTPIVFLLAVFAFSTWVIVPISNLLFRINPYGKYMLDKDEIKSSNFVGISFCLFLAGLIAYFVTKNENFFSIAAFGFIMMVPLGRMFDISKYKNAPLYFSVLMGTIGLLAIYVTFMDGQLYNGFSIIFLLCFVAYQWLANYWAIKSSNI
ncbi:tetratricopeptide repeat protein [Flavobacterium sp. IMCC34852]|uniref:Tetratricopeptide repeat protein n=1 Tax=Flavobacterium rivulicola TaxID=2732161 RepID=A0A7Y3RB57_9FLAO|nr:tetratricopeptide repeat protein [Flavobacterium sp. IMCC34852]NNT72895.1 tetratricopeptide repeat protein [Flavobacterium sp. IMCC34852]